MQPVLKRSDRTSPGERAGERLLQPLFCGAQERWRSPPDSRSQAHQQSALQASVQNDIAGTGPCANSPLGTGCVRGFKGCVLSHSDSTASQTLSEVCSRGHSVTSTLFFCLGWLWPHALSQSAWTQLSPPPLRASGTRVSIIWRLADLSSVMGQPYRQTASSLGVLEAVCGYV